MGVQNSPAYGTEENFKCNFECKEIGVKTGNQLITNEQKKGSARVAYILLVWYIIHIIGHINQLRDRVNLCKVVKK